MVPAEDAPIGMISIDGKYRYVKVKEERVWQYPYFQAVGKPDGVWQKGEVRTISVSAVSSRATFSLDCVPVRGETNEMGMFPEVFKAALADWGETEMGELFATDAGSASLKERHAGERHRPWVLHDPQRLPARTSPRSAAAVGRSERGQG